MEDRVARLESTLEQLRSALEALQERVDALESGGAGASTTADIPAVSGRAAAAAAAPRDPYDPIVILSLIGRLLLVLAGGFFLRAMTEAGILAVPVGVASAFAYGLVWLVLADRAGRRRQPNSAIFHALAAALVVFPLLVEATTRFKVVDGSTSALVMLLLSAALLAVAWRQRLHAIAWVCIVVALPTSVVLLIKSGPVAGFGLHLLAIGVATLLLGYARDWTWLRWPAALAVDVVVVGVTARALSPQHQDVVPTALLLQLSLLAAYLACIAVRTLVLDRTVSAFEILQTAAALVIGFGGALLLTWTAVTPPAVLGIASLLAGAACYAVAFFVIDRRQSRRRNLEFYSALALAFVLAGLTLELRGAWLGAALATLAVVMAWAWSRFGRTYLLLHAAAYGVAAATAPGALAYAVWALGASPGGPWFLPAPVMSLVLAAVAASAWLTAARPYPEGGVAAGGLRLAIVLVLVVLASGWVAGYLGLLTREDEGRSVDAGALATVRTCVLATITLATAWIARHARFREWAWVVYPLLVVIGLKMVVQDFKDSRPATLFIALALYGAALILAPRLKRTGHALRPGAA